MEWMNLTAPDFVKAVKTSGGVCVLPLGSIEKHGDHLPVGIDTYAVQHRTRLACEKANVVMFPAVPFAENAEAMNNPGAVAMRREVLFDLVWNILDEIGRNGFRKIVIVSGHGGNVNFVGYLLQDSLYRDRDYLLYRCNVRPSAELQEKLLESEEQAHAGEQETSMALTVVPNLRLAGGRRFAST